MNKFQKGLQQSMIGVIGGIAVVAIMKAFVDDGLVPAYFVWLFVLFICVTIYELPDPQG